MRHAQTQFRLLVVRLGAMGDILHALPAITALRQAHPSWEIGWVVEPRWRALLAAETVSGSLSALEPIADGTAQSTANSGQPLPQPLPKMRSDAMPLVDSLHLAPAREWSRRPFDRETWMGIAALRRELRRRPYDAVLDLQGAVRSALIARLTGCPTILGEDAPREPLARCFFSVRVATGGQHVIEQDIELAASIAGDVLPVLPPLLPVDAEAEAWCNRLLDRMPQPCGAPIVLINPGAGWGAKRWPIERYAEVAASLSRQGCQIVVNAGPGEEPLARQIVAATGGRGIAAYGTLSQLIALTRRAGLLIAGDTGPLHLACALKKPVVGIFGPTEPSRNGPFGTESRVLRNPESKRDHTRRSQPEWGLLTIQTAEVLAAANELLQDLAAPHPVAVPDKGVPAP